MSSEDFYDLVLNKVLARVRRRILEAGANTPNLEHRTERLVEDLRRRWLELLATQRREALTEAQRLKRQGRVANLQHDQIKIIAGSPPQDLDGGGDVGDEDDLDLLADTPSDRSEDEAADLELIGVDADFAQAEEAELLRSAMAVSDKFGLRKGAVEPAAVWQSALPASTDPGRSSSSASSASASAQISLLAAAAAAEPRLPHQLQDEQHTQQHTTQQLETLRSSFAAAPKVPGGLLLQDGEPMDDDQDQVNNNSKRRENKRVDGGDQDDVDDDDGIEEAGFFDDDEDEEQETRKLDRLDQDQLVFSEDDDPEDRIPFCPIVVYCMQGGLNAVRKTKVEGGEVRSSENWKVRLQNGIVLVDGQELVFRSGRAEFVW